MPFIRKKLRVKVDLKDVSEARLLFINLFELNAFYIIFSVLFQSVVKKCNKTIHLMQVSKSRSCMNME